jgi:hypothetical protein
MGISYVCLRQSGQQSIIEIKDAYILVTVVDVPLPLHGKVHQAVNDTQRVEVQLMRTLFGWKTLINPFVLLLEEPHEAGSVLTAVALGPEADPVVVRFVVGKLREPYLGKVPQRVGSVCRGVGRAREPITACGTDTVGGIHLGYTVGKVGRAGNESHLEIVGPRCSSSRG